MVITTKASTSSLAFIVPTDRELHQLLTEVQTAVANEIFPIRIPKGTSGSYFARNQERQIVAVFKPKNEEPYASQNPKWTKWLQRLCCPCCFGRTCLPFNQGYLSEVGASLIDDKFQLGLVPKTNMVYLAADTFNYRQIELAKRTINKGSLPGKLGSFQLFVNGYESADVWLQRTQTHPMAEQTAANFQRQFERLVVLDYIIRNTDRGGDNWLIKAELGDPETPDSPSTFKIAAIDNGLAFPFKHPDEWRSYPYGWAWLPYARIPFSTAIRDSLVPLLDNIDFVTELCDQLQSLFKNDSAFKLATCEKQMAVMRGQIHNLSAALKSGKSPLELIQMAPVLVTVVQQKIRPDTATAKNVQLEMVAKTPVFRKF